MEDDESFDDLDEKKARELAHSRRLDVHRWSDHPEANAFVNAIYEQHFSGGYENIQKRNLKVVLLDLYVAWQEDPNLKIAYSRNSNYYLKGSIYNELNISRVTVDVVDRLLEVGFLEQAKGFYNKKTGIGRLSRMWPTKELTSLFEQAMFTVFDIGNSPDRLPIELRDENGDKIEYAVDTRIDVQIELLNR